MSISQEDIAAFADGELTGARVAEVAAAIAADPRLQRQVEEHRALKARLSGHFAPIAEEPVPEALAAMLAPKPAEIVDFAAAREKREARRTLPRWSWIAGPAIAASLALAVFLPGDGAPDGYADLRLAGVLDSQLVAEQQPGADTRILLSFRDGDGDFCRAFTGSEGSGIACRDGDGWKLEALGEGSDGAATDYRMAGISEGDILARAQQMAEGPALDAMAEQEARASGWR
ncbi:MAG: anti-sigma factor [Erythrobacter sp.]